MLVNTAGLKTTLNAIKEYIRRQIGKIKRPDWNQNDESSQDYIKNRTHWKEENTEKYEKVKLTSFLQDGRVHFYSLGGQIRFGGEVDFSVYPFSLRYGGAPIPSDKIPLNTLLLTSLAYTSCSGMSVYDEKEQLIGHFQFDALTFTAANDTYYTDILLEVPYNYNTAYTVVLESKPVYHKIPQEYLNTYIFELEVDETGNFVSPFSSDEILEMFENGTQVICRNTAAGIPGGADYRFVSTLPVDGDIHAIFVGLIGPTQVIIEINHDKHVNTQIFNMIDENYLADYQTRSIEDSEKYFGEDPTVEGALKQVWKGKQCWLKKNASGEYQIIDWNSNIIQPDQVPENAVIWYNHQLYYPYSSSTELCFMSISFTHCSRIVLNKRYNAIWYNSYDNFTLPLPVQRTSAMTQPVGVGDDGKLWTAPASIIQPDWNQNDNTKPDYIKNRPLIATNDDAMDLLAEIGIITPITNSNGEILTSSSNEIYSL